MKNPWPRFTLASLWACTLLGLASALDLFLWYWPDGLFQYDTAGIYCALAWDTAQGQFYRPLLSPEGYGGTRYMPLFFVVHAGLIRVFGDPVWTGWIWLQASVGLAVTALVALLRQQGLPWKAAVPLGGWLLATAIYQETSLELRCDYLAAGLVAWALWWLRRGAWRVTAGLLALAFFTKLTCLYALLVAAAWLYSTGRPRLAAGLMVAVSALCLLGLALAESLSGGNFSQAFLATADGGGLRLSAPRAMLSYLSRDPFMCAAAALLLLQLAVPGLRPHPDRLVRYYLVGAWGITLVIFSSPGIGLNHHVETHLATLFALGSNSRPPSRKTLGLLGWTLAALWWAQLVGFLPSRRAITEREGHSTRATLRDIERRYLPAGIRYLAVNPLVPVLRDERAFVLDVFNLNHFVARHHPVGLDFERRIAAREFQVILLTRKWVPLERDYPPGDPELNRHQDALWNTQRQLAFVRKHYRMVEVRRPWIVLLPAPD
jgi:hypothetical protein